MKRAFSLLLPLVLGVLAPQSPARADRDPVGELLHRYVEAYRQGDAEALTELYAENALLLPCAGEEGFLPAEFVHPRGRAEIEKFWKRHLRSEISRRTRASVSGQVLEMNAGSEVGYLVSAIGGPVSEARNVAFCLRRDERGEWRIAAELWNPINRTRFVPAK